MASSPYRDTPANVSAVSDLTTLEIEDLPSFESTDEEEISLMAGHNQLTHHRRHWNDEDDGRFRPYRPLFCAGLVVVIIGLLTVVLVPPSEQVKIEKQVDQCMPIATNHTSWEALLARVERRSDAECCDPHTEKCSCHNPFQPTTLPLRDQWNATFERNKRLVAESKDMLDVVMYGDSITEHWLGTALNVPTGQFAPTYKIYQELFVNRLHGLALGISGDRMTNLLYRLRHGELPDTLQADVWWILIGTNDYMFRDYCSTETLTAGIIKIVQEIQELRPFSTVVINSLLPVGSHTDNRLQFWSTYTDVNHRLECFAESHAGVEFFNATSIFLEDGADKVIHMMDGVHPDTDGARLWGTSIVEKVEEIQKHHRRQR